MNKNNIYWQGFSTFFKIGFFTIGGGYAMIPLFHDEVVVKHKWISEEDFLDTMSIAQSLPGVFAINFSTHIGYLLRGLKGSIIFALGAAFPSLLVILALAICFQNHSQWPTVEAIMKGIRPAVVALIAVPCIKLWKNAHVHKLMIFLPVAAALLIWLLKVSPAIILLVVAVGAFMFSKMFTAEEIARYSNKNNQKK